MAKITKIEKQKKKKGRYFVYIDGEFAFGVHEDVLVEHTIRKGMEIEKSDIERICKSEENKKAYIDAVNLLSYKMRTKAELARRLTSKGHEDEAVEDAVERLSGKGYIDDQKYAVMYANEKMNKKSSGRRLVAYELQKKGIDQELAKSAIEEVSSEEDEYESALEAAKKKLRTTYRNDEKNAAYRKLGGYLSRRGYPYSVVSRALREALKDR